MQAEELARALLGDKAAGRSRAARVLEGRLREPTLLRAADAADSWGGLCLAVYAWARSEALASA